MRKLRLSRKPDSTTIVFIVLGALIVLFIVVPLIKTVVSSSPGTLWNTLLEEDVTYSILLTIFAALIATLVGLFLGVPLAYLLARHQFRGKRILEGLIDIPIVVPHSAVGIALLFVFGSNFFMGKFFGNFGISFFNSVAGVVIAMMFVSVPFLIDSAKEGFKAVDPRLEKVARTLGASSWRSFFRISLPLAWRGIFSGSVMMWARGASEFGAVLIIAYYAVDFPHHPSVAPILVSDLFRSPAGLDAALPVTAILIIICLIVFIVLRAIAYKGEKT
jgi:molybdate/tungstate transport system permease protein